MASDRAVIRAVVEETSFGLYSKHDILKMSVKEIRSPVAFNELGNPLPEYVSLHAFACIFSAWLVD